MSTEQLSNAPAYAPFKTFLNSLETLRGVVPGHVNRSLWPSFSGGTVSQIITTYRFLGLIDDGGRPTRHLAVLAGDNVPLRQSELRQLLQHAYAEIVSIDLTTATPKQLMEAFADSFTVTGATLQKAISFFLNAAQYAELPLAQFLTRRKGRRRRVPASRTRNGSAIERPTEMPPDSQQGTTRTIQLASGGEIALRVQFDAFTISQGDREFIFNLIDQLAEYEGSALTRAELTHKVAAAIMQSRVQNVGVGDDDVPF
jgi:hypothetical protein